ncbi:hypothetical protein [Shimia sp. MIT1388]|uniref:hypothetical protein n=1 Tax=Shimia sp. MIT1388 TaxID=3096992 RepID=UPI0039996936
MNIIGDLVIRDSVVDFATSPELYGALSVVSTVVNGTTYVYVSSAGDDGIQILTLGDDGSLTAVGTFADTSSTLLNNPRHIDVVTVGGNQFLVIPSANDDSLTTLRITGSGPNEGQLVLGDTITNGGGNSLDWANNAETFTTPNGAFVAVSAYYSDAVSIYQIDGTGALTLVDTEVDTGNVNFRLGAVQDISIHSIGGKTFLYASSYDEDGISVFEISNTGQLAFVTSVYAGSVALAGLVAGTFNGQNVLIASDFSNDRFYVYQLDGTGSPSLLSTYNFGSINGLSNLDRPEIIQIAGVSYIVAASEFSDSLNIFTLDNSGNIELVTQVQDLGLLNGAFDVEHVQMGSRHFLLVTAYSGHRITSVEVGASNDALVGTSEDDRIVGLNGNDDLIGREGDDQLIGGNGDDVLSGRIGNDYLSGGDGSDVLIGGRGNDILQGGDGLDILVGGSGFDLVSYSQSDAGVTINLTAKTASGGHATGDVLSAIEDVRGSNHSDVLVGDHRGNTLSGGNSNDSLRGEGGNDKLFGGSGQDWLLGGNGYDLLSGGSGSDQLFGQNGHDTLIGGDGHDKLLGGNHDDRLSGGRGNDTLNGGTGDDTMIGSSGQDVFVFVDNHGTDVITDFENGDLINFRGHSSFNSFSDVFYIEIAGNTYIGSGANTIQLTGFSASDLDASDFLF